MLTEVRSAHGDLSGREIYGGRVSSFPMQSVGGGGGEDRRYDDFVVLRKRDLTLIANLFCSSGLCGNSRKSSGTKLLKFLFKQSVVWLESNKEKDGG